MDLTELMEVALFDGVIECEKCGNRMEPDAEKCGECGWENPIRACGLI
jgi:ribosomal protein L40E